MGVLDRSLTKRCLYFLKVWWLDATVLCFFVFQHILLPSYVHSITCRDLNTLQLADALPTELLYTPHPTDLRRILQLLPTLYFTNPRIVMKKQGVDILVCDFCQSLQPVFHWQPCRFEENIRFYTKAKLSYKLIVQKNK